jgi:hypothetical protein
MRSAELLFQKVHTKTIRSIPDDDERYRGLTLESTHDDDGKYTLCQREVYRFTFGKCRVPAKELQKLWNHSKKLIKYSQWLRELHMMMTRSTNIQFRKWTFMWSSIKMIKSSRGSTKLCEWVYAMMSGSTNIKFLKLTFMSSARKMIISCRGK